MRGVRCNFRELSVLFFEMVEVGKSQISDECGLFPLLFSFWDYFVKFFPLVFYDYFLDLPDQIFKLFLPWQVKFTHLFHFLIKWSRIL
jgi:hypothetical protein